jgi:plasmid stabilization system protein ParE
MTRPVYRREAQTEFDEAHDWYENRRSGLGAEFAEAVQHTIDRIVANPVGFAVVRSEVRCAVVRRFPFAVYYPVEQDRIVVISIFHGSRDPKAWQSRLESD